MVSEFHDGMKAQVTENEETSYPFTATNGVKQECVLAPNLFSTLFAAMLIDDSHECDSGAWIRFREDGKLYNVRRLQAKTKVLEELVREVMTTADDCALAALAQEDMKIMMDYFASAYVRFGPSASLKKTA